MSRRCEGGRDNDQTSFCDVRRAGSARRHTWPVAEERGHGGRDDGDPDDSHPGPAAPAGRLQGGARAALASGMDCRGGGVPVPAVQADAVACRQRRAPAVGAAVRCAPAARGDMGAAGGRAGVAVFRLARRGRRGHAGTDLRDPGAGPEYRGGLCRPARPGLRRLLCDRRLYLCAAEPVLRAGLLGMPADRRGNVGDLRLHPRLPGAAPARRLPGHRHPGLRRDHPHPAEQHDLADRRPQRHRLDPQADPVRPVLRPQGRRGHADLP
ncbi:hypothetical protein D9M68_648480 [compost metagenome]